MQKIVILTGAGISAESGLVTFKSNNGLWNNYKVEDVATMDAFECYPDVVHRFCNELRSVMQKVQPNKAHRAISMLQNELLNTEINIITQNIDLLHEKAGNKNVYHIHGRIDECVCMNCRHICKISGDISSDEVCPSCEIMGMLKPNVVFFGEMPQYLNKIEQLLIDCDKFIAIGTSGLVYPAASFVNIARNNGAITYLFNLEETQNSNFFDFCYYGKASEIFVKFAENLLIQNDLKT